MQRWAVVLAFSAWGGGLAAVASESAIKADEQVVFYPTVGWLDPEGKNWRLEIHGSIFEPEPASWKRDAALRLLRANLPGELSTTESKTLDRRLRLFLVDDERGKSIDVRIGSRVVRAGVSGADGHFRGTVELGAAEADDLAERSPSGGRTIAFEAVARADDSRKFAGRARLLEPTGLSVVSDVDDTIKISEVRDRRALLRNTFLRPFKPTPGMADFYRRLEAGKAAFHYVSGSPWQLYSELADFRRDEGFPEGSFHLKSVRLSDSTFFNLFGAQEEYKRGVLEPLFIRYPKRRFVLVGDTGEQDPEIFGRFARERPEQVVAVFLRNVTQETRDNLRMTEALTGVARDRWALFEHPREIEPTLRALGLP